MSSSSTEIPDQKSNVKRKALLVGSMPFGNETLCMTKAMDLLGHRLLCMPDGEVGEIDEEFPKGRRQAWVITAILANVENADAFTTVKEPPRRNEENGFMSDMLSRWIVKPNYPPEVLHEHIDFGYLRYFRESYPIFQRLREDAGKPDMPFQVGVPTGGAISMLCMSIRNGLKYRMAMNKRIAYEVEQIMKEARNEEDVIIQVEAPHCPWA